MKVGIYARVSTTNKGQNPERQVLQCENYANLHNHEVVLIKEEYGTGDSNPFERNGFKEILKYKVKGVIIYEMSRFSREHPIKVMRRIQELKDKGIKIISITEPHFNMEGEFADLILYFMTWFNNYYLVNLKRNIQSGLERARKKGKILGRPKVKFNKLRAYELLINKKLSQREVAKELNVSLATINRFKKVADKREDSL